jgi:hypothetical protein
MAKLSPEQIAERSHKRITEIRAELAGTDYVCSGMLLKRMKTCGHRACRCAQDPGARHGPYYEWGHMKGGKLVHLLVSAEQANLLRKAIAAHRQLRKLSRSWENETKRLVDAQADRQR